MDIVKVAAIGLVAGVLAMAIRKTNPEIAMQLSIATGLLILLMVVEYLGEATEFLRELQDNMGDAYDAIGITIKIVGIAYISEFSTQALKDAGETAIASKVELAGKLIITVMTLPLIKQFTDLMLSFSGG